MKIACVRSDEYESAMGLVLGSDVQILLDERDQPVPGLSELLLSNWHGDLPRGPILRFGHFHWLPPVRSPQKIFGIGLNYADHAEETKASVGKIPVVFNKLPSSLSANELPIRLPNLSEKVDYEAELVVVISRSGRNIPIESARDYIFGYCCGNDVSARDWQKEKPGGQWLLGKSFDSFAPIGPWITTADEVGWPVELDIQLTLNGEVMQSSNTRKLIFGVDFLVAHLSKFCTLQAGDLIFSGTPSGVGVARTPPRFLLPGDRIEVTIQQLGTLVNPVVASDA